MRRKAISHNYIEQDEITFEAPLDTSVESEGQNYSSTKIERRIEFIDLSRRPLRESTDHISESDLTNVVKESVGYNDSLNFVEKTAKQVDKD